MGSFSRGKVIFARPALKGISPKDIRRQLKLSHLERAERCCRAGLTAERCQVLMHRGGFPSALPLRHSWWWSCDSYAGIFDGRSKIVEEIIE